LKTVQAAVKAGADVIVLCDTNGGSLPEEVAGIIDEIKGKVKAPFGIHAHNDCGLGVANSLAAIELDASRSRARSMVLASAAAMQICRPSSVFCPLSWAARRSPRIN